MGNCVFRGFGGFDEDIMMSKIKVVTSNGRMMELYAPITAECITKEFPGHALFKSPDGHGPSLLHNQELCAGECYYLLPLINTNITGTISTNTATLDLAQQDHPIFKFTNNGNCTASTLSSSSMIIPYRMSLDNQAGGGIVNNIKRSDAEVFPRYNSTGMGVWKVKLVISPQKLCEILSQEAPTEALIESIRNVAKCGNRVLLSSASSSVSDSNQCT